MLLQVILPNLRLAYNWERNANRNVLTHVSPPLWAHCVILSQTSLLTCFSSGGSLLHSLPSILVISGKGTSGRSARSCSRLSFMKRTYPVRGALGALLSFIGFFLFLPLVQLPRRGFCQKTKTNMF